MLAAERTEPSMQPRLPLALALTLGALALAGCAQGNVRAPAGYAALAPPPVRNPWYDPYAAYGSADAIWRPPVYDVHGTIVKPIEPASQASRPNYEGAEWATGGSSLRPPGTF
jgi:hypothetical protein